MRKRSAGGEETDLEESLRGSVGNSGGRRVVNFRLHRRAPSRLPHPTLLYLPSPRPSSSSPFLPRIASFFLRCFVLLLDLPSSFFSASSTRETYPRSPACIQTAWTPSYSSRALAYDSASLRLNAYADCR